MPTSEWQGSSGNCIEVELHASAGVNDTSERSTRVESERQRDLEENGNLMGDHRVATISKTVIWQLYISHFLSTWNSRLFEFGAVLFLAAVFPGTLLPVSVYAVSRGGAAIIFAQGIGRWIDRAGRLTVVRLSIVLQRISVIISCIIFWLMLDERFAALNRVKNGLFSVTVLLSCAEKVSSTLNLVAVERDWVVVMTQGSESYRTALNARMRRIDLFCKLVGPLTISLIGISSITVAIWATMGMSTASVAVEYFMIQNVFHKVPALSERRDSTPETTTVDETDTTSRPAEHLIKVLTDVVPIKSMKYYFSHPAFIPSFSLSLLYLTVLSLSGQMITYLISVGYTAPLVGAARAVSTVFELTATWIAPRLVKRIGTIRGGIWSLSWQMAWLAAGTVWLFTGLEKYGKESFIPATGLAVAVAVSRIGLWCYDLCAQNIIQDEIEDGFRGSFSTSESAFQNLFEIISYATTIIFPRPEQFKWPVLISVVATYLAGALYSYFVRRRRRHLFHVAQYVCYKQHPDQTRD